MKQISRACALVALILSLALLSSCGEEGRAGEYTYKTYTSALGTGWNPHTWQTSGDRAILDYLTTPLVSVLPLDTDEGRYQWCYELAASVEDVTASHRDKLRKYGSILPEGVSADEVSEGFVYEITLRPGFRFESGEEISADDFIESMELLLDPRMKNSRANSYTSGESALAGASAFLSGEAPFSSVGLFKTGEYSFAYVTESYLDRDYFLASLSSHWLVDTELYKNGMSTSGELVSTDYGTGKATTSSYGPYRIEAHQSEKEMVLVRNEAWPLWEKDGDGNIVSYTLLPVDGEIREQYMTTKIVISVMDSSTAKQFFLKGELSEWTPPASDHASYKYSDAMYSFDETYTMSLFFNTDLEALRSMDRSRGNINSVVLSSGDFRRGLSLAIDRAEMSLATEGYSPQFALLNEAYYYDIYADPDSCYRETDEAKAAICRLYDTDYGIGSPYPTLDDAYKSITGYDPGLAGEAFASAFTSLVSAGLYHEGEEIRIRIAYSKGALSADDNQQIALLNHYVNRALEGTGFGRVTFEGVGRVANRYAAVPGGEYAIGYGAWGGAAFYPFRALLVYMDPEYERLHEGACWSPDKELLTLTVDGEELTMTYTEWTRSLTGSGMFSRRENTFKLYILSRLEEEFLGRYYRIPLFTSVASTLLSYKISNYTDSYDLMYGFGGFRLIVYHYDDKGWQEYVRASGGRLSYE
ncbi:MAG: hypothetical protein IKC32_00550 [Clostridia bacterium]|nr:hypothetical protein [Clostridia bacterium]